jgi:hypothetical protein
VRRGVGSEQKRGSSATQMVVLEDIVKIQLSEPSLLPELVAFLRDHGCLAYLIEESATVAVTMPDLTDLEEAGAIQGLADQWRFAYPLVTVTVSNG